MSSTYAPKTGDNVRVGYIHDNHKHNGKLGTVTWVHYSNFFPNGDTSEVKVITQVEVTFDNGESIILPSEITTAIHI